MTPDELIKVLDEQVRCLDALVAPLIQGIADVLTCSHPADIHPSVVVLCSNIVALHRAVEDAQRVIEHYEDAHASDVPPELLAAGEVVEKAAKAFFEAVQAGVFSGLVMPSYAWRGDRADLRLVASFATLIIDRVERYEMGIPTNRDYRRDLERTTHLYYTFIDALLIVLALDAVRAAAEGAPDISEAAHALVSGIGELSRVIENERALFEANGIEPPLLDLRAWRRGLQDKIEDNLRAFAGNYPTRLPKMRDRRAEDLLASALARDARRLGVIVFSTTIDGGSPELLHAYDADQIKYARGLHS